MVDGSTAQNDIIFQKFEESSEVLTSGLEPYSKEEMGQFLSLIQPYVAAVELRGLLTTMPQPLNNTAG